MAGKYSFYNESEPMAECEACLRSGEESSTDARSCECQHGYENFGRIRALLGDNGPPLAAFGDRIDECRKCDPITSPVWNRLVCPGGPKQGPPNTAHAYNVILARPRVGYWMSSLHGTDGGPNQGLFSWETTTAWSKMNGNEWLGSVNTAGDLNLIDCTSPARAVRRPNFN